MLSGFEILYWCLKYFGKAVASCQRARVNDEVKDEQEDEDDADLADRDESADMENATKGIRTED